MSQLAALIAVGAVGVTALSATTATQRLSADARHLVVAPPVVASFEHVRGDILDRTVAEPARTTSHAVNAAPPNTVGRPTAKTVAAKHHAKKLAHTHRWVPSGTGMWIYQWNKSNGGDPTAVVERAKSVGLTHLFVRTGSSHDGFTGGRTLKTILPAAKRAHIAVIAWDFPELDHPVADARRLARAAKVIARGGARISAVAPDIETAAEGTSSTPGAVRAYLIALRKLLPKHVAILTTVPWPSSARLGHYPYSIVAGHSDALLPMAYWYNNSPVAVTQASVRYLSRFHRPVMPVGQGYDGSIDVPSLPHNNLKVQVPAFFATAHDLGVPAVSVWSWQSAPRETWGALKRAHELFPRR